MTNVGGQSRAETAELLSEFFQETLRPAANTGGARVMGIQFVGADPEPELHAAVPESWAGEKFCVRTGSSDGLYDSENTYLAPVDTDNPVVVPHIAKSSHATKLKSLDPQGYGVRILGAPCTDVTDETPGALAMWRSDQMQEAFLLFVNSFDADRLVAFPSNGKPVECGTISADISVAFDRSCLIAFDAAEKAMSIRLVPVKNGQKGRAEFVTIELP